MSTKQEWGLHPCPKCGNRSTEVIGRSGTPIMLYIRCTRCGHISTAPAPDEKSGERL